jgi:hypothetical protein
MGKHRKEFAVCGSNNHIGRVYRKSGTFCTATNREFDAGMSSCIVPSLYGVEATLLLSFLSCCFWPTLVSTFSVHPQGLIMIENVRRGRHPLGLHA